MDINCFGMDKKISEWILIVYGRFNEFRKGFKYFGTIAQESERLLEFLGGLSIFGVVNIISERIKNLPNSCTFFGTLNQVAERIIKFRNEYPAIKKFKNKLKLINQGGL
jgi:hypothetical protein